MKLSFGEHVDSSSVSALLVDDSQCKIHNSVADGKGIMS